MKVNEMITLVEREFAALGFKVLWINKTINMNGPDCFVQKDNNKPLSVEIKTLRKNNKTEALSVEPISEVRQNDDLIFIIINNEYALIETMKDHLKCCGPKGYRPMSIYK